MELISNFIKIRGTFFLLLVSGESKKPVIETMIIKGSEKIIYPAQLVKDAIDLYIFIDINFLII